MSHDCRDMEDIPLVEADELVAMMEKGEAVVLNVLAPIAYERIHIAGSISAPFDRLEDGEFDSIGKGRKVVVYCESHTCLASGRAAAILRERGVDAAAYEGGIREWAEKGMPTEGTVTAAEYLRERKH